jgi:hypothetical protein
VRRPVPRTTRLIAVDVRVRGVAELEHRAVDRPHRAGRHPERHPAPVEALAGGERHRADDALIRPGGWHRHRESAHGTRRRVAQQYVRLGRRNRQVHVRRHRDRLARGERTGERVLIPAEHAAAAAEGDGSAVRTEPCRARYPRRRDPGGRRVVRQLAGRVRLGRGVGDPVHRRVGGSAVVHRQRDARPQWIDDRGEPPVGRDDASRLSDLRRRSGRRSSALGYLRFTPARLRERAPVIPASTRVST